MSGEDRYEVMLEVARGEIIGSKGGSRGESGESRSGRSRESGGRMALKRVGIKAASGRQPRPSSSGSDRENEL
jgi:hypothetical protein